MVRRTTGINLDVKMNEVVIRGDIDTILSPMLVNCDLGGIIITHRTSSQPTTKNARYLEKLIYE